MIYPTLAWLLLGQLRQAGRHLETLGSVHSRRRGGSPELRTGFRHCPVVDPKRSATPPPPHPPPRLRRRGPRLENLCSARPLGMDRCEGAFRSVLTQLPPRTGKDRCVRGLPVRSHQLKHHLHRLTCLPTPLYTESSTGRTMLWALEARNLGYVRGDQILHGIPGLARSSIAHRTGHPRAPRWLLRKLWNRLLPLEPYPGFVKSAVSQIQDCCTYSRLSDNVQHEMC